MSTFILFRWGGYYQRGVSRLLHGYRCCIGAGAGRPCPPPAQVHIRPFRISARCVTVAQTIPESVLLKADDCSIPTSWICDNKYFTGQGAEAVTKRISEAGRLAVLDIVHEAMLGSAAVNGHTFQTESHRVDHHCHMILDGQQAC